MTDLKDKKIVIVGGTTGIGLSAAKAFIGAGANVVAVGRNQESVQSAENSLGDRAHVLSGDASRPETARLAIEKSVQLFGGFDGLYHVAGGSGRKMGDGPLHELSLEGWNRTLEWNLTSLMLSNQAAVQKFLEQGGGGTILNMGSVLGFSPSPHFFSTHAYAAAKSAVIGFTKSIAAYYAKNNIRVNLVAPAVVETPMSKRAAEDEKIVSFLKKKQPLDGGRLGIPGDVDGIALFFMSDASKFVTGQIVAVDGGWSVTEGVQ